MHCKPGHAVLEIEVQEFEGIPNTGMLITHM